MSFTTGDRVRVTFEAEVGESSGDCICTSEPDVVVIGPNYLDVVVKSGGTVESVYKTFPPRTVVRGKRRGEDYYICEIGYVPLSSGRYENSTYEFTSEFYKQVVKL